MIERGLASVIPPLYSLVCGDSRGQRRRLRRSDPPLRLVVLHTYSALMTRNQAQELELPLTPPKRPLLVMVARRSSVRVDTLSSARDVPLSP